ncbi:conserved hypothetical protein [Culex quinquefasciatus]|uniref:Uncharacterized protein n=1 Tax=Culex quinquefasciatus TaxID=7176 RepID=B0X7X0_CULQU|nr:conserved hypothetical protein [Culex quinquefasciatus]|eukprot:XP_001865742.1 conserved hypothetical protein [Culex quinquefasciatus]
MMTAGPDGRAVPFQKNLDKQQLMQALLLNGNGRTQQQRSKRQNNLDEVQLRCVVKMHFYYHK